MTAIGKIPRNTQFAAIMLGFGAGIINGLTGIGGGLLIVPGLVFLLKLKPKAAVATSLAAILFLSAVSLGLHLRFGVLELSLDNAAVTLVSGFFAAQLGARILRIIPQKLVLSLFSALTISVSIHMIAVSLGWAPTLAVVRGAPPVWVYATVGALAGLMSGILGIGGGGMVVFGLTVILDKSVVGAIPLALMVNLVNSLSGVIAQWRSNLIQWPLVWRMAPTAFLGAGAGTYAAVMMPPATLRVVFATIFLKMGLRILLRSVRREP